MDPSVKMKDPNCNVPPGQFPPTNSSTFATICSNDSSFTMIPPPHHDLVSANSIELNAAASLSDDSGVPLTTNSSISSGDSYRLGMCKFEIEMIESDGEVSQFDSLDNCSEGGMSAENFNTLKKGPLAPIDPPPEFQDSPKTTLVRSISKNIVGSLRRWTSSQSSFEHLKYHGSSDLPTLCVDSNNEEFNPKVVEDVDYLNDDTTLKDSYAANKHLYSSDSILNTHTDNIYDEPNNIISNSLGNSVDIIESDSSSPLPPPPPPVSIVKIKQTLCPYYQDHTRYFKAIPSEQDNITTATQRFNLMGLSEIHDYDLYYGTKRSTYQQFENSLQRKVLYSPRSHTHHCHSHHYHAGIGTCGNRPNSRNSLNSRLSSSHNSLSVSSSNKPDDSIFITQAMSHDALLSREISDFYNVPIDSDIYAFPVDMIEAGKDGQCPKHKQLTGVNQNKPNSILGEHDKKCAQYKSTNRRVTRNRRKKRLSAGSDHDKESTHTTISRVKYRVPVDTLENDEQFQSDGHFSQEPLHMTLDEAKQFYHTLYSDAHTNSVLHQSQSNKTSMTKSSNETIWSLTSTRYRTQTGATNTKKKNALNLRSSDKNAQKYSPDKDNINNNNNNVSAISNHNDVQQIQSQVANLTLGELNQKQQTTSATNINKNTFHVEKKSQFTLNLKQKFCSIFRFRRSHNRCRIHSTESDESMSNKDNQSVQNTNEKHKKLQTRALPPLPNKNDVVVEERLDAESKKCENRAFQFTSSIEKVKDYGWYWGPLSSEAAEKVLSNEPDGSFIVRDSSDDHYIFSLSFKLNNCVRHVRIEQDQGTFSFGSYAKFKSQTITEFIEKAVEHSRSGRYLFFLHRRPEHGPMRVQLTNPVSRFKHVQSLQHMCRFIILKAVVRKDLIQTLPLPRRLLDYLNYKHCYSEQVETDSSQSQISGDGSI